MPPKEPTRQQLTSRLAYNTHTPSFLIKLQNQVAGRASVDNEDEPQYLDSVDEFGRDRRPPLPERPDHDERISDGEDDDEKPVVVVLKEGKHLTELEAKNERRKAEGLPPLPTEEKASQLSVDSNKSTGLSFSSKWNKDTRINGSKRKTPDMSHNFEDKNNSKKKKKKKNPEKVILSFDRNDMG